MIAQAPSNAALTSADVNQGVGSRGRWRAVGHFFAICLQLGLALLVVQQFQLESRSFFHVAALMVGGFVVHSVLPFQFRQGFFAALSILSIIIVFGVGVGLQLVVLGTILIALCHLPARFATRVILLVAVGLLLAAFRGDALPWLARAKEVMPTAGWAILGSMFMFRLAVYMHALQTREPDDPPPTVARTTAYFFMAPNVAFPLFPVIDYDRFTRNYYDRPALEIYQTGAKWIARGLLHLLLYRLIYRYFVNDPATLRDLGDVLQHLLSVYLLYLRVSGTFHLVVGLLNLFGYHLPETHRLYYLADSFSDYWRRINIYWKDFMMKLVYYPSYFGLRKFAKGDNTKALVWATAFVFVGTWALHSYQWFWLRGSFPLEATDILFWGILGGLVVWHALREAKRGRQRMVSTARTGWSWSRAVRVTGVFATLCVLWSLWSAESLMGWIVMWRAATIVHMADLAVLAAVVVGWLAIAGRQWDAPAVGAPARRPWYRTTGAATTLVLLIVCALAQPSVQGLFGDRGSELLSSLQRESLNARDAARARLGYYEKMDAPARRFNQPWDTTPQRPAELGGGIVDTPIYRRRDDFLVVDNRPSISHTSMFGTVSINRWGMRGTDVEEAKAPGTVRVAFMGPSYIFGPGVPDWSTLPASLARRLNAGAAHGGTVRYEVLNFGVSGTSIIQALALLDARAYRFSPDIVIVGIDTFIPIFIKQHLTEIVREGISIPYAGLSQVLADCGVELAPTTGFPVPFEMARKMARALGVQARMPKAEIEQRLMMCDDRLAAWALEEIASSARKRGAVPVAAVIDMVHAGPVVTSPKHRKLLAAASAVGFVMADLRDVWVGRNPQDLLYAPWDDHPGAYGYELLADRLFEEMDRQNVLAGRHGVTGSQ